MSSSPQLFFSRFRQWLLLSGCVGGLALLMSCGTKDFLSDIYGDSSKENNVVMGPRRAPMFNPNQAPPQLIPAPQAAVESAPKKSTDFDKFDEDGNEIRTNYFKEWFGGSDEEEAAKLAPKAGGNQIAELRRPFPGNPWPKAAANDETIAQEALPIVPGVMTKKPMMNHRDDVSDEGNGVIIMPEKKRSDVAAGASVMLLAQAMPQAPDAVTKPVPALSSVPPKPTQFEGVKAGKEQQLQELQTDHDAQQEKKKELDAEPSQIPPVSLERVSETLDEVKTAVNSQNPIMTPEEIRAQKQKLDWEMRVAAAAVAAQFADAAPAAGQ